jgi:arylsulfatase A-like enzyme
VGAEGHRAIRPPHRALSLALSLVALACAERDPRPSVVLIVIDTLRADAVSAHGAVQGTTPFLDSLAAGGLRYTHAYAPSPWTLPSHASLFTGQGVERHRVGMDGRLALPERFVTLAERFQEAGYETAVFSENLLVSDVFHLLQGFRYRQVSRLYRKDEGVPLNVLLTVRPPIEIPKWLEGRPRGQPFFLFVNLFDPHTPYTVREESPFLPAGASREEIRARAEIPEHLLCDALPTARDLDILHGLYLGEVAEADRKVEQILGDVRRLGRASKLVTVVTSDHGELFGERRLLGHEFNVLQGALHVPLIVSGLDVAPAVIDAPVALVDVAVSIVEWAGLEPDASMDGRALPRTAASELPEPRPILSAYNDRIDLDPTEWGGVMGFLDKDAPRRRCGAGDKVFGSMASIIDYPFKYHWFERYPPELYDLSWDPHERSDLLAVQPELSQRLAARIEGFLDAARIRGAPEPVEGIGREEADALKALGYAD